MQGSHFRRSSLLPPSWPLRLLPPSHIAFIEELLTLELPIVLTFGNLTIGSGLLMPFPLRFMPCVGFTGDGLDIVPEFALFICMFEPGALVLLFLMFLFGWFFWRVRASLAFSSLTF